MANLALFDFDGTITSTDTFVPFIRRVISPAKARRGALRLAPQILAHRLGCYPATKLRMSIVLSALGGRSEAEIRAAGAVYARSEFAAWMRPEAVAKIAWHRQQGDELAVVSASLDAYLTPWCQDQGFTLLCSTLAADRGVLTGRYLGGDCTGEEKARRVRQRFELSRYPVVYAYGDTEEDRQLLSLGQRRFFRWQDVSP